MLTCMLIKRQKTLYYYLQQKKTCSKLHLAKIFFTLAKESTLPTIFKFYYFTPYKFGPYSFELFHDLDQFQQKKIITITENKISINNTNDQRIDIPQEIIENVDHVLHTHSKMNENKLLSYVYETYPDYTIFSHLDKRKEYHRNQTGVLTIGYQGKSIDEFLHQLIQEKIEYLIDVRKNPWSMKYGYTKSQLETFTGKLMISYQNIPDLGIPSNLRQDLNSKQDYLTLLEKYRKTINEKKTYLSFLKNLSTHHKIALLCFEKDPQICHRRIIGETLQNMGSEVTIH